MVTIFLLSLLIISQQAFAQSSAQDDDEFQPLSKRHLRGRRLDERDFTKTESNEKNEEKKPVGDLKGLILGELKRVKEEGPARSGLINSFKDNINNVRLEGRFETISSYLPISDNYLRNMERAIRSNIFPPIIARTIQQSSTVIVTFVVRKDGSIEEIEKEASSGSAPLDATAVNACRSSSPLPPIEGAKTDLKTNDALRVRFVLTFNP